MPDTRIEWTDWVWNPVTGCTKVSDGCKHCYAERMSKRLAGRCGYPADEPFRVTLHPEQMVVPLRWRKPRRVFVCSMGDLFHPDVPDDYVARAFNVMMLAGWHTYQILTKRPARMADLLPRLPELNSGLRVWRDAGCAWPPLHVWLGTSVENQATSDERIPHLLRCRAKVRFLSCEPLLGPVDLSAFAPFCWERVQEDQQAVFAEMFPGGLPAHSLNAQVSARRLSWCIAGGESGPGARRCNPDWLRGLRDQCQAAGVPFFVKQLGGHPDKRGHDAALLDGRLWRETPVVAS